MQTFYESNQAELSELMLLGKEANHTLPPIFKCDSRQTIAAIQTLSARLENVNSYTELDTEGRRQVRRLLLCIDDTAKKVSKMPTISAKERDDLNKLRKDLTATTEYAPTWVIIAVAMALGVGTMIGWKRIVLTVGEKIGQKGMTYSQGMSAQITAAAAIGIASITGMPVSTTHVLSSAVAGTMVANRTGLQSDTVKNIVMAWVLTLPATILLSGGMFYLLSHFVH